MRDHENFWDRNAARYDRFMRKDRAAYEEMYALIRPVVKAKTVLELATGTGLIAKHIVNAAAHIEATDASAEMIAEAKRDNQSAKLHFSVQDKLEQWCPVLKASFPMRKESIEALFRDFFNVDILAFTRESYPYEQYLEEVVASCEELEIVGIYKEQSIYVINLAIVEITDGW